MIVAGGIVAIVGFAFAVFGATGSDDWRVIFFSPGLFLILVGGVIMGRAS